MFQKIKALFLFFEGSLKSCFHNNACKSPTKKMLDFFLHILSSSHFLECTVSVHFCGPILKTLRKRWRQPRKTRQNKNKNWRWRNNGSHLTKSSPSLDCSGEGTEMCVSLLVGLRNVGTQRAQHHPASRQFFVPACIRVNATWQKASEICHFLSSKMLAFYICDRFHVEIKIWNSANDLFLA